MKAIEIKDLLKKYGDKTVVNSLNLTINKGELFSLLGVNGAGKTTTIKMLSCLTEPTSGDAILFGDSIIKNPQGVKRKLNLSPQENAVAMNLTVRENLEFIARIYGFTKKKTNEKVEEMIETFRLGEFEKTKAKTLSGGWQRRLSIAMSLVTEPEVLFLDEPTLGLDVLARRELWKTIENLKGKITIILTTHYMEEAESLSDRIAIMAKGDLKAVGTPKELINMTNKESFEDAFVEIVTNLEVKK